MKKQLLSLFVATALFYNTKAQVIFSQNFNDQTLESVVGTPPNAQQFDGLGSASSGTNTATVSIENDKLKIYRTESGSSKGIAYVARTTDLVPPTQFFKIEFKLDVSASTAPNTGKEGAVQLLFGNSFTNNSANNTGDAILNGMIGINTVVGSGFKIRDITGAKNFGTIFTGEQPVTIFYNATSADQTYMRLDNAESATIGAGTWTAWVGTTQVLFTEGGVDMPNRAVKNPEVNINNFKIYNAQGVDATFLFDDFTITSLALTTTPVSLKFFDGKWEENFVRLNWQTVSEQNNSHFEILRSANGKDFTLCGAISGHGNTQTIHNYSFIDHKGLNNSNYYYILRQVDLDGKSTDYAPIFVEGRFSYQKSFSVNADKDWIAIIVNTEDSHTATLHILDIQGRETTKHTLHLESGINRFRFSSGLIPAGVYIGVLTDATRTRRVKFTLQ